MGHILRNSCVRILFVWKIWKWIRQLKLVYSPNSKLSPKSLKVKSKIGRTKWGLREVTKFSECEWGYLFPILLVNTSNFLIPGLVPIVCKPGFIISFTDQKWCKYPPPLSTAPGYCPPLCGWSCSIPMINLHRKNNFLDWQEYFVSVEFSVTMK